MATQISPGLYLNDKNELEVDVPEWLAHHGIEDTEENRDICVEMMEQQFQKLGVTNETTSVKHTHHHRCPRCGRRFVHDGKRVKCPLEKKTFCGSCNS